MLDQRSCCAALQDAIKSPITRYCTGSCLANQLAILSSRDRCALLRKAADRIASAGFKSFEAGAAAPPGCNRREGRESRQRLASLVRSRTCPAEDRYRYCPLIEQSQPGLAELFQLFAYKSTREQKRLHRPRSWPYTRLSTEHQSVQPSASGFPSRTVGRKSSWIRVPSLLCDHDLLIDTLNRFGRNADFSSIRIVKHRDQENQQSQQG